MIRDLLSRAVNKAMNKVLDTLLPVDKSPDNELLKDLMSKPFPPAPPTSPQATTEPGGKTAVLEEELQKKIQELDHQVLIEKAKNLGLPYSGDPEKKTFLIKESDVLEGTEKDLIKSMIGSIDKGQSPNVIDLTRSIQVWAKMVQKAAGTKIVKWAPDSVMNKVTFSGEKTEGVMNERVLLEVGNGIIQTTHTSFLPEGFTEVKGDVKSVHVVDLMKPVNSDKATEDDEMDMISDDLGVLTEKVKAAQQIYRKSLETRRNSAEALTKALEESGLKANHKILTEEEVKMMTPESAEEAKEKAEMLKKFRIESKTVGSDFCKPGCKCGLDRSCPGYCK